jgi:hypothetical protein
MRLKLEFGPIFWSQSQAVNFGLWHGTHILKPWKTSSDGIINDATSQSEYAARDALKGLRSM